MSTVVVLDYDPAWPEIFARLRSTLWNVVGDFAISIEHIGSTSVAGLAAKPIIDLHIIVSSDRDVQTAIERLSTLDYLHRGNLGIDGREAFSSPHGSPAHHLYLCQQGSLALRNHLAIRDYLRANPEAARAYGELKKSLAEKCRDDIETYIDGKTDFILAILGQSGLTPAELEQIALANRKT